VSTVPFNCHCQVSLTAGFQDAVPAVGDEGVVVFVGVVVGEGEVSAPPPPHAASRTAQPRQRAIPRDIGRRFLVGREAAGAVDVEPDRPGAAILRSVPDAVLTRQAAVTT
jgi:hypothetical protein